MTEVNISNKKVKYVTDRLERDTQIEPICGNFSYIDFDSAASFERPETTFSRKEQMVFDGDDINKGNDYRRFVITGDTKRMPTNFGDKYIVNGHKSAGRGFGDHDISQQLRYGQDTRQDFKTAASADLSGFKIDNNTFTRHNWSGDDLNAHNNNVAPEVMHLVNGNLGDGCWIRGGIDTRNLDKFRKN